MLLRKKSAPSLASLVLSSDMKPLDLTYFLTLLHKLLPSHVPSDFRFPTLA
jgi:hypothetical protein